MKRGCIAIALVVGCHPPAATPQVTDVVPLAPLPAIRLGTSPDWCWAEPRALRPTDLGSLYVAVQVERALAARLLGTSRDNPFPHLDAVRTSGNPIYLVGPVAVDPHDLTPAVHVVHSMEPALAAAWDHATSIELVQLALVGYVQDADGHDAQRFTLVLRHVPADRSGRGRGTTSIELCVTGRGEALDLSARVVSES